MQVYDSWDGFRGCFDWSPVIGAHDPPGLEVRDDLLDHVTKPIDLRVVLPLPIQELAACWFLERRDHAVVGESLIACLVTGSSVVRTSDSLSQDASCRLPSAGSEIHARRPDSVQATRNLHLSGLVLSGVQFRGAPPMTSTEQGTGHNVARPGIVAIQPEWRCLVCPELRGHTTQLLASKELTALLGDMSCYGR